MESLAFEEQAIHLYRPRATFIPDGLYVDEIEGRCSVSKFTSVSGLASHVYVCF